METVYIQALAHALPQGDLSHEELCSRFGEKHMDSVVKMTGIKTRRVVKKGQCASDLACAAAQRLLSSHDVDPKSIDLLTFTSQSPDYRMPATASVLQHRLGLSENCCTFDMNQACSAYIPSLQTAYSMIRAGTAKRALVLNADTVSTMVHPMDKALAPLHGDGACATLIGSSNALGGGIEFFKTCTDGGKYDKLIVPAGGARQPSSPETRKEEISESGSVRNQETIHMDGPAVFHFVIYKIKSFLEDLLREKGTGVDEYDHVLFHQANKTMIDLLYKGLSVPTHKRFYNLESIGNCGGASLPVLLSQAWSDGIIRPGMRTLICAFGAGLSWGAASIRWPEGVEVGVSGDCNAP